MNATEQIAEVYGKPLPELNDIPRRGYYMFDTASVECEVGEFLYGLMCILHPQRVLTTGICNGISDAYLALGLRDNGYGVIDAIEDNPAFIEGAVRLWKGLGVMDYINPIHANTKVYMPDNRYQFMWLDTEQAVRFMELEKYYPLLDYGCHAGTHDMQRKIDYSWAEPPKGLGMVKMHFLSPRGVVLFYKPHPDDWRWEQ